MTARGRRCLLFAALLLASACGSTDAVVDPLGPPAINRGWDLCRHCRDKQYTRAVNLLVTRHEGWRLEDIRKGFLQAGGSQADWALVTDASRSPEYREGASMGTKLRQGTIEDVTVVEYLGRAVMPRADETVLAFTAGFVSAFGADADRGQAHLDALIMWASNTQVAD